MYKSYKYKILVLFLINNFFINCFVSKELLQEIKKDFNCCKVKKITKTMIYNEEVLINPLVAVCSIIDNNVSLFFYKENPSYLKSRKSEVISILKEIAKKKKLPNMRFLIHFGDRANEAKYCPIFNITKNGLENIIRFPLMHFNVNDSLMRKIMKENINYKWNQKRNQMFWRSQLTGYIDIKTPLLNKRFKLCDLSIKNPSLLNAKITGVPAQGEISKYMNKEKPNFFAKWAQEVYSLNYKYLPLIDGFACPTAFFWMMFAESVIFRVESSSNFHFTSSLKPFVHYVPIKPDLSDLFEKYQWAENNQDKCINIIGNANNFAKNNLMSNHMYDYWECLLDEYSKIYEE